MNTPIVSIILPVFNDESRIERSIRSALRQTFKELEVLVIDDGSTDHTPEIIRKIAQGDSRLKILSSTNNGAYFCRNLGLQHSNGKYIGFLDSDDWLEPTMYEKLVSAMETDNADIAICSTSFFFEDTKKFTSHYSFKGWPSITYINEKNIALINGALWNKLYRSDLIKQAKLSFGPYRIAADTEFNWKYFINFSKAAIVKEELYNYSYRENSLVTKKQDQTSLDVINVIASIQSYLYEKGLFQQYKPSFYEFISPHIIKRLLREKTFSTSYLLAAYNAFGIEFISWNFLNIRRFLPKLRKRLISWRPS